MRPFRPIAILIVVSCAPATPPTPPTPTTPPTSSASPTATATATATATVPASTTTPPPPPAPPAPRCAPGQLNTPCVFERGGACFFRQSNCTDRPCTEPAPARVDCAVYQGARTPGACEVAGKCGAVNVEGCSVTPCDNKLQTCLAPACVPRILAATSCSIVTQLVQSTPCHGHR